MISNREKTVLIIQSSLIIGSKYEGEKKQSMFIARKMQQSLNIVMSLDEFVKICQDIDGFNNVELEELSFQMSNR
tara:strand:+ start:1076 stop:1300 length:225 start_codon:yes stop_codon:yes gene_type:complete